MQVKSGDGMVDRLTLDQLVGAMSNFKADFGMLVSWSGFKKSVLSETVHQFFRVRLWDARVIIQELFTNYNKLDEDLRYHPNFLIIRLFPPFSPPFFAPAPHPALYKSSGITIIIITVHLFLNRRITSCTS